MQTTKTTKYFGEVELDVDAYQSIIQEKCKNISKFVEKSVFLYRLKVEKNV